MDVEVLIQVSEMNIYFEQEVLNLLRKNNFNEIEDCTFCAGLRSLVYNYRKVYPYLFDDDFNFASAFVLRVIELIEGNDNLEIDDWAMQRGIRELVKEYYDIYKLELVPKSIFDY